MNKKIALISVACALCASLSLTGCGTEVEEPSAPADADQSAPSNYGFTPTDAEKLKGLAPGETAVWRDYEVTVRNFERTNGKLMVNINFKTHTLPQKLTTDSLLSFGMAPLSSTFEEDAIEVGAGESVDGTLTFDDRYNSQRLFWNDGATEGWWLLDLPAVQGGQQATNPDTPEPTEQEKPAETPTPAADTVPQEQKQAIAALEAEIPSLFENNTFFVYQSVDSTTAEVKPLEAGGYEYINEVSILNGEGAPTTAHVVLICEPNGNCISMTIDGAFLF